MNKVKLIEEAMLYDSDLTFEDLKVKSVKKIVELRRIAIYFVDRYTDLNLLDKAFLFGINRSYVIQSIDKVNDLMQVDKRYRIYVDSLRYRIEEYLKLKK